MIMVKRVYFNEDTEKGYCTWGWFEDNILNTFFGFVSEKDQVKKN